MGKNKKIVSIFVMFSLIFTALFSFSFLPVFAQSGTAGNTKVNIVKVKVNSKENLVAKDHDGTKLEGEKLQKQFGEAVQFLPNVKFAIYDVKSADNLKKLTEENKKSPVDTEEKIKNVVAEATKKQDLNNIITNKDGVATIEALADGFYWIIEEVKPAGYDGAAAVPFALTLPLYNREGIMKEVWIYPKNTVTLPFDPRPPVPGEPDKEPGLKKVIVEEQNGIQKDVSDASSYNMYQEQTWKIQLIAPEGVNSLKHLIVREYLDKRFDFVSNSIEVKINDKKLEVADYEKTEPTSEQEQNKRLLQVKFNEETLKSKINKDDKIIITYKTKLNNTTQMGAAVYNGVQVVWGQGPNPDHYSEIPPSPEQPTPPTYVPPTEPDGEKPKIPDPKVPTPDKPLPPNPEPPTTGVVTPKIYLGGMKFVKQDTTNNQTKLSGAEFVIKKVINDQEYVLKKDYSYILNSNIRYNESLDTQQIMVLKSSYVQESKGSFEIKGLALGSYKLVEIKAPEGYALPTNPEVEFTITATSYYTDVTNSTPAEIREINNTKLSIPQTGGIGTVIFIVGGMLLMLGAGFVALKRRKSN